MKHLSTLLLLFLPGFISGQITFNPLDTGMLVSDDILNKIVITDLDDDGYSDVIGTKGNSNLSDTLTQYFNIAGTGISLMDTIDTGVELYSKLRKLDFNNDGREEVLTFRYGSASILLYEQINDTLTGPVQVVSIPDIANVLIHDLDGDELPEIVVSRISNDTLFYISQDTLGNYSLLSYFKVLPFPAICWAWGDLDANGHEDLAFMQASFSSGSMGILYNDGSDYSLDTSSFTGRISAGLTSSRMFIEDMNNDGLNDLVTTGLVWGAVVHTNTSGIFDGVTYISAGLSSSISNLIVEDFNQDGFPDLAAIRYYSSHGSTSYTIRLTENMGGSPGSTFVFPASQYYESLNVLDFENDGDMDIIASGPKWFSLFGGYGDQFGTSIFINHLDPCDTTYIEIVDSFELGTSYLLVNDSMVDSAGTYIVEIESKNGCPVVYTYHLTTYVINSINNISAIYGIEIFPNPATDRLFVEFKQVPFSGYLIELYDALGKQLVHSSTAVGKQIDIPIDLPAGTYILNILSGADKTLIASKALVVQ